ncbi:MAG: transcriptional regulator [Anaerolineae bacterium]|nr:transcriptional regulator [Anaerolineae bacterium]
MVLTRDFKETVLQRAQSDAVYREALLAEAVGALLQGDLETGKAALRVFIKATVSYDELSEETGLSSKSLIRMFGPTGNPRSESLVAVLRALQSLTGVRLSLQSHID